MRKRIYASVSAVAAALSMGGCFDACNLVKTATFNVGPNPAEVGEQVGFETVITMRDGGPRRVDFDLDGDGTMETTADPRLIQTPTPSALRYLARAERSYASPATIEVRGVVTAVDRRRLLDVGFLTGKLPQNLSETDIVEYHTLRPVTLQVQRGPNQPPLASFTVSPNPVAPEGQVTYDASESRDPDGQIVRYEWDLNGDGTFELDTGTSPTTTQMESTNGFGEYPQEYTAGLRVTDSEGETATTTRQVRVEHPPPRLASTAKLARSLADAKSLEVAPAVRAANPGELQINGDELIVQDRIDRGRLPGPAFPGKLRRGKRDVRWKSSTDAVIDTKRNAGTARGIALLSFPAGGRACMVYRVESPPNGRADGAFRVLGGVGRASGLRGRGTGEGKVTGKGVVIDGRFDLDFRGKRNFKLGESDCGPLRR